MALKGIIFDVDGVIIDTAHIHHMSWKKVFQRYGVKFTYEDFKTKIDGMPRDKGVKKILPFLAGAEIEKECAAKQAYFEGLLRNHKVKVFKSSVNLIKKLKKQKYKIAMASSSKNAKSILKKLGIYKLFDADAEGAMIKKGKPYPDIFLKAAKKLKVSPRECVVFEDAASGVIAAKKAKMKCVGIDRTGTHGLKGADLIVDDLREVNTRGLEKLFERGGKNGG